MVEYARKGLIGVLTPQANTTVEPEFAILMPPGYAFLNARLVSDKPTINARLDDYFAAMEHSITQFANAPMGAVAFACTGASYLQGVEREQAAVEAIETGRIVRAGDEAGADQGLGRPAQCAGIQLEGIGQLSDARVVAIIDFEEEVALRRSDAAAFGLGIEREGSTSRSSARSERLKARTMWSGRTGELTLAGAFCSDDICIIHIMQIALYVNVSFLNLVATLIGRLATGILSR